MGGKRYFCDYCCCYLTNSVNVRKMHMEALSHKINKIRYLRTFEDPRKVYDEEISKQPCSHFFKGRCRYDLYCQSSHYSRHQLEQLKQIADNILKNHDEIKNAKEENTMKETRNETSVDILPWNKDISRKQKKFKLKKLPPSLRPINIKKLAIMDNKNTWV